MKPIVLIGRADCWEEDFHNIKKLIQEFDTMAIGVDCSYKEQVDYLATYHPKDLLFCKKDFSCTKIISHRKIEDVNIDIVECHVAPTGSSALLGVLAAINKLNYTKIVLCGCPLIGQAKNGFKPYDDFQKGWIKKEAEIKPYVRSMSGWTKEFLGEPTKEWLDG